MQQALQALGQAPSAYDKIFIHLSGEHPSLRARTGCGAVLARACQNVCRAVWCMRVSESKGCVCHHAAYA